MANKKNGRSEFFDEAGNFTEEGVTVTLELDDGPQECEVVTVFSAGGRQYIALLPLDENGQNDDGEVYLYRFMEKDGEPSLDNIETDEEYEIASEGFDAWLDDREFDEIIEEDPED